MKILFDNRTEYDFDCGKENLIKNVAKAVLESENFSLDTEISFSIVSNKEIREINKKYRNIDKETDVLSFPLIDFENEEIPNKGTIILGDIIISIEKTISQAKEYGHSITREIAFLTAHSMLHLLGYDHMTENEEKIMFEKQESILKSLNIAR